MTAEIGIMNKSAVALAADSAVTVRNRRGQKVYNFANKLFQLSKHHPIGIMIYGNAELSGIPWETIIKVYRNNLNDTLFDTLQEYCDHFFDFLQKEENYLFDKESIRSGIESAIFNYLKQVREELDFELQAHFEDEEQEDIRPDEIIEIIKKFIQEKKDEVLEHDFNLNFTNDDVEEITTEYYEINHEIIKYIFQRGKSQLPIDNDDLDNLILITGQYLSRDIFNDDYSGVVIAGFGEKEIFPTLCSYKIECKVSRKLKYKYDENKSMQVDNLENEGGVFPFAQDDMVHTILSGVDREYEIFSKTFLNEAFHTYPIELLSIIRQNIEITDEQEATLEELFSSSSKELFKKYNEETNRYLIRHHVSPIFNTIEILPKEELASIAETLVNITSFKRKISAAAETVGGPVDVALITKGDGFIWIKRKHYFDPQLNHHFFDNYYRRG